MSQLNIGKALGGQRPVAIRRLDRYELLEQVGMGGMAAVYRGRDTALDRQVAVKVLHPHLAARPESRARFSREARAVARLSHPNIVEIFDYSGDGAEESYLVTEFVAGRTLRAFVDEVGVGYPEIGVLLARALCDALVHAHSAGVIHRDLKPENVMVSEEDGRRAVKLTDFGIARILASDERMTMTGALVGSPNHMAPEIVEGREADARSDVFSLGTLLYWVATGRMPFAAPNPTATLRRVVEGDYQDPRQVSALVSDGVAAVIDRAMASDPADRYPSAAALRDALDGLLAEVGLAEPEAEVEAFLSDPSGYRAGLRPRLLSALLERGEAALEQGNAARALGFFNRVLALEPENTRVLEHLARLARRARLRRLARMSAVGLGTFLLLACAAALLARLGPSPESGGSETSRQAPPAESAPSFGPATSPADAAVDATTSSATLASPPASPSTPARRPNASPVELAVQVRPYAQRALIDGVEVARGQQRVLFELSPGSHTLRLEHECCAPYERVIDARLSELRASLEPKPARLRVDGDPATRIYLGGLFLGTAGDSQRAPIPVPVPAGAENPYEGQVELRLQAEGQEPRLVPVRVRAGGDITVASLRREGAP
jgi:eukaryotic-like serine/threonine-protein kinase